MFHCSIFELISFVRGHTFDVTMTAERLSSPVRWAALLVAVMKVSRPESFSSLFLVMDKKETFFIMCH